MARWLAFERTSLLYGRHLDVLALCSLYGTAKVNNLRQVNAPPPPPCPRTPHLPQALLQYVLLRWRPNVVPPTLHTTRILQVDVMMYIGMMRRYIGMMRRFGGTAGA